MFGKKSTSLVCKRGYKNNKWDGEAQWKSKAKEISASHRATK